MAIVLTKEPLAPRKQKRKTNQQIVANMMNYSACGGLKEAFILTAIEKYSQQILREEPWAENSLISFEAWQQCAKEVITTLEQHYAN